jgi:hypothetical protein
MTKAPKAEVSRTGKKEEATPVVAPSIPVKEKPKASDKPNPDAKPKKVTVLDSGLTIEEY